jgi:diphthamide biosynthesis enzyme Dph1/Dph2-like protein
MNQYRDSIYELELERIINSIKKANAKIVCIQLPDGLKPQATEIAETIERETKAKCIIWLGSCFGACDIPNLNHINPKVDLLVQWGHSPWLK